MYSLSEKERLRVMLSNEKPGLIVQKKMAPSVLDADKYYIPASDHKRAGVLIMLYERHNQWHTVYIKRATHAKDKHSGQISFPGGRLEKKDQSMKDCALRETEEELGISRDRITILGELSPLHVYASNHLVFPFVGILEDEPIFDANEKEVEYIYPTPLNYINDKAVMRTKDLTLRGMILKDVPYYDLYGEMLWGATAMMTAEFLHIWNKAHE
jgi:8-oxo-dGTP pyrophosphatase MutT (NUDIX family)